MSLMRWNPLREMLTMREAMDRFLEHVPHDGGLLDGGPELDLIEKDDKFIVKAELPGFAPENVDIRVEGNTLFLKGEYKAESEKQEGAYHIHERHQRSFSRTLNLPTAISADKAVAEFENGILTLTLPKDEAARAKKITIKTAKGG